MFLTGALFLLLTVVLPVVCGHLLGRNIPSLEPTAKWLGASTANLTILIIISAVVGSNRAKIGQLFAGEIGGAGGVWPLLLALTLTNLGGYSAGYFGAWLLGQDEPRRRALTIEIGMQNAGLGALLAKQLFPEAASAMVPPALFTFGCMFTGTMLATAWAWLDDWRGVTWSGTGEETVAKESRADE